MRDVGLGHDAVHDDVAGNRKEVLALLDVLRHIRPLVTQIFIDIHIQNWASLHAPVCLLSSICTKVTHLEQLA